MITIVHLCRSYNSTYDLNSVISVCLGTDFEKYRHIQISYVMVTLTNGPFRGLRQPEIVDETKL